MNPKKAHCDCGEPLVGGRCPPCEALRRPAQRRRSTEKKIRDRERQESWIGLSARHLARAVASHLPPEPYNAEMQAYARKGGAATRAMYRKRRGA